MPTIKAHVRRRRGVPHVVRMHQREMGTFYRAALKHEQDARLAEFHPESQVFVEMSPERFLEATSRPELAGHGQALVHHYLKHVHNTEPLRKRFEKGLPLDTPFLDVERSTGRVLSHEGRHRAALAAQAGVMRIPVRVYYRKRVSPKTERYEYVTPPEKPKKLRPQFE